MEPSTPDKPAAALLKALRWLLRPLVRLLIEKGITYPQLRDLLKLVYVEVAESAFGLSGTAPTDSRIFVLTGVHRKDIKRLRPAADQPDMAALDPSKTASLGGNLVSRWLASPLYQDANGRPRPLPRLGTPDAPGFDELVESITKDVRPRVILDELLRLNTVSLNSDGKIRLTRDAFVPAHGFAEQAHFLGRHLHDHIAAAAHNMLENHPPMLERSVYFAGLSTASIDKLRALAEPRSNALLQELNEQALKLQSSDQGNPEATHRMRLGIYWYDAKAASKRRIK